MKLLRTIIICIILVYLPVNQSFSFPFGTFGARALGLGNAYTGLANDLTAVYWNPAGIAFLESIQIAVSYDRFLEDNNDTEAALEDYLSQLNSATLQSLVEDFKDKEMLIEGDQKLGFVFGMPGVAFSVLERNFATVTPYWGEGKRSSVEDRSTANSSYLTYSGLRTYNYSFSACYGKQDKGYFWGLNTNYIEYKSYIQNIVLSTLDEYDVQSVVDEAAHGSEKTGSFWSFDLSMMMFMSGYRLGITAKDLTSPKFKLADETTFKAKPQYRLGIVAPLSEGVLITLDYDLSENKFFNSDFKEQQFSAGFELRFFEGRFNIRMGGHKNIKEEGSPLHYTAGTGFTIGFLTVDAAGSYNANDQLWDWSGTVAIFFE